MNLRATQIYISWATRRSLKVIARAKGANVTIDELADQLLREKIAEQYPTLVQFEKGNLCGA